MDAEPFWIRHKNGKLRRMRIRKCPDCKEEAAVDYLSKAVRCKYCAQKNAKLYRPFGRIIFP